MIRQTLISSVVIVATLFAQNLFAQSDGPSVRVLIKATVSGTALEITGQSQREELLVVAKQDRQLFRGGFYELRFDNDVAELVLKGGQVTRFKRPFRLQGADEYCTWVRDPQAKDLNGNALDAQLYGGWIEVVPPDKPGEPWQVVNRLPLETYLLGVVGHEMPASGTPQASLEAQAIACRTYALYEITARGAQNHWHVHKDVSSQVYGGLSDVHDAVRRAVNNTRGQVLQYQGRVFRAYFHSTCGGGTGDAYQTFRFPSIPPLQPVPCTHCRANNKNYHWRLKLSRNEIANRLRGECRTHGIQLGDLRAIESITKSPGSHADYVRVVHSNGSFEMDSKLFRRCLRWNELRSTRFVTTVDPNNSSQWVFEGTGFGHGVGMCQYGAMNLGAEYDAVAILEYYYPGSGVYVLWK